MKKILLLLAVAITLSGCGTLEMSSSYPMYYDGHNTYRVSPYVSEQVYYRNYANYVPSRPRYYNCEQRYYNVSPYQIQSQVNLNYNLRRHCR